MLINDLLVSKFIQAHHAGWGIRTKNNLPIPFDGVFDSFFKLFRCFYTTSMRYIQLFCKFLHRRLVGFLLVFVTQGRLQKYFGLPFTPREIHHHHHHSTCCIVVFLHRFICTLHYISEDDSFYLVCRQNQSLTLPLRCDTCRMERLDHEKLFLCVLSTFQLAIDVLAFYRFSRQFFK